MPEDGPAPEQLSQAWMDGYDAAKSESEEQMTRVLESILLDKAFYGGE